MEARFVRDEIGHPSAMWEAWPRGELVLTLTLSYLCETEMFALLWLPEGIVLQWGRSREAAECLGNQNPQFVDKGFNGARVTTRKVSLADSIVAA
jgi:hypothetical protein